MLPIYVMTVGAKGRAVHTLIRQDDEILYSIPRSPDLLSAYPL